MDAVSTVIPGVATGVAPPVDSDAQAPAAGFPAALGQALAQPAVAADGNGPPPASGQMLPVLTAVTGAAAELITPAAAPAAADGLPLPADAQPSGAVAEVVDALGDIARGQKAASAAAQSGAPQSSSTVSSDPVAIPVAACGVLQATDASEGKGADAEAATVIAAQVSESAPGAARRATRRAVTADPADPAAAGQLPPGLLLHAAPIARMVANAVAAGPDAGHGRQAAVVGAAAEQPTASAMTPAVSAGLQVAMAAQEPGLANESAPVGTLPGNELAAALQLAGRPGATAAPGGPPVELPMAASPGSPQFSQELGERLLWLVREGVHEARLQLNPRELGPIEVRVGVSDGAAQLSFSAQHAGTVAAVQQSLPQLREMLAQQGLQLGQADVSQQQAGAGQQTPQQGSSQQAAAEARGSAAGMGLGGPVIGERVRVIGRGLVDAYA
ncbi:MAG TPA: flagellar hook-length control protein FliK [Immundisolibacter sp.]|nr:flagellar hook-length control protein FliK [Immundisolibacter sp.]